MSGYTVVPDCQLQNLPAILEEHIGFKQDGVFIEVGGYDGKRWSKTWELAELGWKGLIFEPLPESYAVCVQNHRSHNVLVVPYAASGENGTLPLYASGLFSRLEIHQAPIMNRSSATLDPQSSVPVRAVTLDWALDYYNWPIGFEFLSVNTYGSERLVLSGLDLKRWRPKVMVWQLMEKHPDKEIRGLSSGVSRKIKVAGYRRIYVDGTHSIFVADE